MTRDEQKERKEKNINTRIERVRKVVAAFLETNGSDKDLEKILGISSSTIGRDLTTEKWIVMAFPLNGEEIYQTICAKRKENLYKGKLLGSQVSKLNNIYRKGNDGKFIGCDRLRLDLFGGSTERQLKLLVHMALTFRAKLPLLSELFKIPENELLESMLSVSTQTSYNGLVYLLFHDFSDQEIALTNVINFCSMLVNAINANDKIAEALAISLIDDGKINELIKTRELGDALSDEAIMTILNWQLKYALPTSSIVLTVKINRSTYVKRVQRLLANNESLASRYQDIMAYNQATFGGRK